MSLTFVTSDGERIQTSDKIKTMSKMLETMELAEGEETPINVPASVFKEVIEFCMSHDWTNPEPAAKPLKSKKWEEVIPSEWARTSLRNMEMPHIVELAEAADFLDIPPLLSYCCARVAFEFTELSLQDIQNKYGFHDELTLEEEITLVKEHPWIREKKF